MYSWRETTCRFSKYSALVFNLLLSMFALLAHWFACVWHTIRNVELEREGWTAGRFSQYSALVLALLMTMFAFKRMLPTFLLKPYAAIL